MNDVRKLIRALILETNLDLNLSEWKPPGQYIDPGYDPEYDPEEYKYETLGWHQRTITNKGKYNERVSIRMATPEQVEELERLSAEKDEKDAAAAEQRRIDQEKEEEERRIAAVEAEKERVANLSPEEKEKEETTRRRDQNRSRKPRRYRQVKGKTDFREEERSDGFVGRDTPEVDSFDPEFARKQPKYHGNAAQLGGNVTNLIFDGMYNFKAVRWIGQQGVNVDDGTDLVANVSNSVRIDEEDEGKPGEEILIRSGADAEVEIGMGPGKR